MEHPGHSNQLVHGNRRGGGQQSLGLSGATLPGKLARDGAFTDAESSSGVVRVGDSYAEKTMASASVLGVDFNGGGVTESYKVDIEGMGECYGKPREGLYGARLRAGIVVGQEFEREMGAHLLNQAMGGLVPCPASIIRKGVPSVQGVQKPHYKDFTTSEDSDWLVTEPAKSTPEWDAMPDGARKARLAAWDSLVWNTDRHGNNVAYDQKSGATLPIDHTLAFPGVPCTYNNNWTGSRYPLDAQTTTAFKGLLANRKAVAADLRKLGLPPTAVNAVFTRAERMVKTGQTITNDDVQSLERVGRPWSALAKMPVPKPPKPVVAGRPQQRWSPHDTGRTSAVTSGRPGTTMPSRRDRTQGGGWQPDEVTSRLISKRGKFPSTVQSPHPPGATSRHTSGLLGTTKPRPLVWKADKSNAVLQSPHRTGQTSAFSSLSLNTTKPKKLPSLAKGATVPKSLQGPTFGRGATPSQAPKPGRRQIGPKTAQAEWNRKFDQPTRSMTRQSPHPPDKTSFWSSGEHSSERKAWNVEWWTTEHPERK